MHLKTLLKLKIMRISFWIYFPKGFTHTYINLVNK
jgi:hypothetical protein